MSEIILSAYHGGLGDNLQFSTLPEEFFKQHNKKTFIWSQSSFRNKEIFDLVWGCNPYISGIKEGVWEAGDTPQINLKNIFNNCILNWEIAHNLTPKNKYPKIYYKPKTLSDFKETILLDFSSISMSYSLEELKKIFKLKKEINKKILILKFKNSLNNISNYNKNFIENEDFYEVNNIFEYCDLINSCQEFLCTHSGQSHLASAIKNDYNKKLTITSLIYKKEFDIHTNRGTFLFDNVDYVCI
jgi:hypothetical protein